jgi:hypothetical protein
MPWMGAACCALSAFLFVFVAAAFRGRLFSSPLFVFLRASDVGRFAAATENDARRLSAAGRDLNPCVLSNPSPLGYPGPFIDCVAPRLLAPRSSREGRLLPLPFVPLPTHTTRRHPERSRLILFLVVRARTRQPAHVRTAASPSGFGEENLSSSVPAFDGSTTTPGFFRAAQNVARCFSAPSPQQHSHSWP